MYYMAIVTGTIASSEVSGHLASSSIARLAVTINGLTTQAILFLMTVLPVQLEVPGKPGVLSWSQPETCSVNI